MAGGCKKPAAQALAAARQRIDDALDGMDAAGPLAERVHEARRELKKARACLRLLAPALAAKERRRVNVLCRDAGRALAPAREGAALERAWQSLSLDGAGSGMLLQRRLDAERVMTERGALREFRRALKKARKGAARLSLDDDGWDVIARGLERACVRLHGAFRDAQRARTDAAYHEWRKRAKDLRYQLELLARPKRRSIGRLVALLETLTDLLGEDHDLGQLGLLVEGSPDEFGGLKPARAVEGVIMRQRRALRRAALALGRRWDPGRPQELARRARESWKRAPNLKE